jgi:hypothetical protein
MILLKNGLIVAAVSIPRIVDTRKLPSRYGKRGYIQVRLAFFSTIIYRAATTRADRAIPSAPGQRATARA